jgi:hypothetical protein
MPDVCMYVKDCRHMGVVVGQYKKISRRVLLIFLFGDGKNPVKNVPGSSEIYTSSSLNNSIDCGSYCFAF